MTTERREPIYATLDALDEEAFSFIVSTLKNLTREAGGFKDSEGIANLGLACQTYLTMQKEPPA